MTASLRPDDAMTDPSLLATTREEDPVFFEAGGRLLFGVITRPTVRPLGVAAILLSGGGVAISANRNRLSVLMAREIAALGYHVMRLDYRGIGESEGNTEVFDLSAPFDDDLLGAVRSLRANGIERFVLLGSCYGGRTALSCVDRIDGLQGVVLVAAPVRDFEMGQRVSTRLARDLSMLQYVRHYLRKARQRGVFSVAVAEPRRLVRAAAGVVKVKLRAVTDRWLRRPPVALESDSRTSSRYVAGCAAVLEKNAPLLVLHGQRDDLWEEFQSAMEGRLGRILGGRPEHARVEVFPGYLHGYTRVAAQQWTIRTVMDWLQTLQPGGDGHEGRRWTPAAPTSI